MVLLLQPACGKLSVHSLGRKNDNEGSTLPARRNPETIVTNLLCDQLPAGGFGSVIRTCSEFSYRCILPWNTTWLAASQGSPAQRGEDAEVGAEASVSGYFDGNIRTVPWRVVLVWPVADAFSFFDHPSCTIAQRNSDLRIGRWANRQISKPKNVNHYPASFSPLFLSRYQKCFLRQLFVASSR